jgi:hypothetical protein
MSHYVDVADIFCLHKIVRVLHLHHLLEGELQQLPLFQQLLDFFVWEVLDVLDLQPLLPLVLLPQLLQVQVEQGTVLIVVHTHILQHQMVQ